MVCAPMEVGKDYEMCEMQLQNERKKDMLDFFNLVPIREAHFLKWKHKKVSQSFSTFVCIHTCTYNKYLERMYSTYCQYSMGGQCSFRSVLSDDFLRERRT